MSKKMILTITDEVDKYLKEQSNSLGISKLEYIRFLINKDRENKK